jgi:ATP-dependent Clp protease ATP-binding subunit ClpA
MWQRFTDRARKVILLAQEQARRMGAASVGTEHLLLGMILDDEGVAAQVLVRMGLSIAKIRDEVERESAARRNAPSSGEPNLSPGAKRALELAADEARRMKHNYIGTEHMLLALIREKDRLAAEVLRNLGLNLEKVREQIMAYLGRETPIPGGYEPKPDLQDISERLLQFVLSVIDEVDVEEKRDRLKELYADLQRVIGQVRDNSRVFEFEQLTKALLGGVGWYKDKAVSDGRDELADGISELQKRVETVLEEIRNLIHSDPDDSKK